MKKKVLFIVMPIALVIIIALSVVIAILSGKNKSVGSVWGDTYYTYLKEAIKENDSSILESTYGLTEDIDDAKIQFCEVKENENPAMVMTYNLDDKPQVNVYIIDNSDKVRYKKYSKESDLKYLYNIENEEYSWYVRVVDNDGWTYIPLEQTFKSDDEENDSIVKFENKDGKSEETKIAEVEKIFVEPEIKVESFDFNLDMSAKELAKGMETSVSSYKENTELVLGDSKEVETSINSFSDKIYAGTHTLEYGTYKKIKYGAETDEAIYIIKSDNTFTYERKWTDIKNKNYTDKGSGTYVVSDTMPYDEITEDDEVVTGTKKKDNIEFKFDTYFDAYSGKYESDCDRQYYGEISYDNKFLIENYGSFEFTGKYTESSTSNSTASSDSATSSSSKSSPVTSDDIHKSPESVINAFFDSINEGDVDKFDSCIDFVGMCYVMAETLNNSDAYAEVINKSKSILGDTTSKSSDSDTEKTMSYDEYRAMWNEHPELKEEYEKGMEETKKQYRAEFAKLCKSYSKIKVTGIERSEKDDKYYAEAYNVTTTYGNIPLLVTKVDGLYYIILFG